MPKVTFVVEHLQVEAPPGRTVREVALEHGIKVNREPIKGLNCGGRGLCGTCKVWVNTETDTALSPPSLLERFHGASGGRRLACRAEIRGDVRITTMPGGDDRLEQGRSIDPAQAVNPRTKASTEGKPAGKEPKTEAKVEPKVEAKEEPKVEAKEEPKVEAKEEPKVEAKKSRRSRPRKSRRSRPRKSRRSRPRKSRRSRPRKSRRSRPRKSRRRRAAGESVGGNQRAGDPADPSRPPDRFRSVKGAGAPVRSRFKWGEGIEGGHCPWRLGHGGA